MKRWSAATVALLLIGFVAFAYSQQASGQGAGWVTLFDGKNLDNWNQIGTANWKLADGVVVADQGNGFLVSKNTYSDFQLRAEFWIDDVANSGIFIRCADAAKPGDHTCYEANIFDERKDPTYGTGAITHYVEVSPMPKAGGKWNTYEITAKGPNFTVVLNGVKTVDNASDSKFPEGRIALQYGVGTVKFRKLQIKPL